MLSNSLIELDRAHLVHPVHPMPAMGTRASLRLLPGRCRSFPTQQAISASAPAWKHGLVIRAFPTGVLGYAPPLCCSESDIEAIIERTARTLDDTLAAAEVRAALQH